MFDVEAYYRFVVERVPETRSTAERIKAEEGDDLYPMLTGLIGPLLVNVGMHGAQSRRRQVFDLVEGLMEEFPEITNEIGVGIVEMAAPGWFAVARDWAGPRLRERLDVWEPGWTERDGPRTRAYDVYGVEDAVKLRPSS